MKHGLYHIWQFILLTRQQPPWRLSLSAGVLMAYFLQLRSLANTLHRSNFDDLLVSKSVTKDQSFHTLLLVSTVRCCVDSDFDDRILNRHLCHHHKDWAASGSLITIIKGRLRTFLDNQINSTVFNITISQLLYHCNIEPYSYHSPKSRDTTSSDYILQFLFPNSVLLHFYLIMSYYLPSNQNSGTVYGVGVSYNPQTWANVRGTYNPTLKSRLEEFAVRAALSRGFSAVRIV